MSNDSIIGLVPLDPVDPKIVSHLGEAIAEVLSLPVQILPTKPLPLYTCHMVRQQHHSTQLLEYLVSFEDQDDPFRLLGITAVDLYIPIFTFVFGEAQLDGRAAIIFHLPSPGRRQRRQATAIPLIKPSH